MCGIGVIVDNCCVCTEKSLKKIENVRNEQRDDVKELEELLVRRGPDAINSRKKLFSTEKNPNGSKMNLMSSVLHIRGDNICNQPVEDADGNLLLWNGEIFGGINVNSQESDTKVLSELLRHSCEGSNDFVLRCMKNIEGPYAFCYWHAARNTLWFGRDVLGRRSLLLSLPTEENGYTLKISSVACPPPSETSNNSKEEEEGENEDEGGEEESRSLLDLCDIGYSDWIEIPTTGLYSLTFSEKTDSSSNNNNTNITTNNNTNSNNSLDYNSCKDPIVVATLQEYKWESAGESEKWVPFPRRIEQLISPTNEMQAKFIHEELVQQFKDTLMKAVDVRVSNLPVAKDNNPESTRIAILFSGGIDSMVIAALADKCIDPSLPIDLLNVAFSVDEYAKEIAERASQKSKKNRGNEKKEIPSGFDSVPDRITGLNGLSELKKWNFVQVNVTSREMKEQQSHIYRLLYPATTIMDFSIGIALWFATMGKGVLLGDEKGDVYTSPAKIILSGLGADEQLGGYTRHRKCWKGKGLPRLQQELDKDFERLWIRNLGRDDRIISDLGREVRFPFLDENFVKFIRTIPLWEVCNFEEPQGVGDKKILREVGKCLGLTNSTKLAKRAIQFGSRAGRALCPSVPSSKVDGTAKFVVNS